MTPRRDPSASVAAWLVAAALGCGGSGAPLPPPPPRPQMAGAPAPASSSSGEVIALGDVRIRVAASKTASLFHAVDQMSAWSPFSHRQYARWKPDGADELLARQRALRGRLGWGRGLERALYVDAPSPREALADAVRAGLVSEADAREETAILEGLEPRLAAHFTEANSAPKELRDDVVAEAPSLTALARSWLGVLDLEPPREPIDVVFVRSPGRGIGGGGANGGVIVVEVPEEGSPKPTLTTVGHELMHALAAPRHDAIAAAGKGCGVDVTTMGEALAYAIAPGLWSYGDGAGEPAHGRLERQVANNDPTTPYGRFARLAIAIRPAMQARLAAAREGNRGGLDELLDAICTAAKDPSLTKPAR